MPEFNYYNPDVQQRDLVGNTGDEGLDIELCGTALLAGGVGTLEASCSFSQSCPLTQGRVLDVIKVMLLTCTSLATVCVCVCVCVCVEGGGANLTCTFVAVCFIQRVHCNSCQCISPKFPPPLPPNENKFCCYFLDVLHIYSPHTKQFPSLN